MAQNGLSRNHSDQNQTTKNYIHSFNPYLSTSTYINYQIKNHHDNAYNKKLSLNHYERTVLFIGGIVTLGMMLLLVSCKTFVSNYQANIMESNARITKIRGTTNSLHQRISNLQSGNRLQKIAHRHNLKLVDKNVRNVK